MYLYSEINGLILNTENLIYSRVHLQPFSVTKHFIRGAESRIKWELQKKSANTKPGGERSFYLAARAAYLAPQRRVICSLLTASISSSSEQSANPRTSALEYQADAPLYSWAGHQGAASSGRRHESGFDFYHGMITQMFIITLLATNLQLLQTPIDCLNSPVLLFLFWGKKSTNASPVAGEF